MAREEEGMALARGGWAVLLAEGTLQEQLRERDEGRQSPPELREKKAIL